MNIKDIRFNESQQVDYQKYNPQTVENKEKAVISILDKKSAVDTNDVAVSQNWKNEILMQGLDVLENKVQLHNNGTVLDKIENRPIETFAEAMKELKNLKTNIFKSQASAAQANIPPSVVFELLTEFEFA